MEIALYEKFDSAFHRDGINIQDASRRRSGGYVEPHLLELFIRYGGTSFNDGLYRVMTAVDAVNWSRVACNAFPGFAGTITCFAYDWLGRIFATDSRREIDGRTAVVMLEPGTGQILELPCNVLSFHDTELVDFGEGALATQFFEGWLSTGGVPPQLSECIGYKRPLFLAGQDTVENLELVDMEVYWELAIQLIDMARALPPGTRIESVRID